MDPFALHIAAAENRLDLSCHPDIHLLVEGFAPIHFAAAYCAKSLCQLLDAGADPEVQVQGGIYDSWEPVHFAARHGNLASIQLLSARIDVAIARGFCEGKTPHHLLDGLGGVSSD